MPQHDFDFFVIGGGSGGVRAARIAAQLGARVALVEERYLGGTCVNVGCVPKKLLVYGSEYASAFADARGFGWDVGDAKLDWPRLIANKDREIARLNGVYRNLLVNAGVTVLDGRGTIVDPHGVRVGMHRYSAERILVATGGWPYIPQIPGGEHYVTSNELFHLDRPPERVVIAGGGYIAVEFAGIFRGFGADVTQVYRGPLFMRGFDRDVRECLAAEMTKRGIQLVFHTSITRIDKAGGTHKVHLSDGRVLEADLVVAATGRVPMTSGLGLDTAGVTLGPTGGVLVNDGFQTNVPSVYAVGDVLDRIKLTPVALAEGMLLARNLFGGRDERIDYTNIPTAVFSQPNVGTVGLTEHDARQQHGRVRIFKSAFRPMRHTISGRDERTLMKLIVDAQTDKVLGCHMVGPDAGEITQGLAIALKCGATKAQFDATIGIHPTAAEEFVTMRTPEPEQEQQAAGA